MEPAATCRPAQVVRRHERAIGPPMAKHRLHQSDDEAYGKHARYPPNPVTVRELLEDAIREGRPLRLHWPGHAPNDLVDDGDRSEQPTTSFWLEDTRPLKDR